jgi:hypothetical protein
LIKEAVVAKTPGIAVGASMIIPGFGQLYANAVVLGLIFVVAWTIPFWVILFSFLIPGLTSLGQGVSPSPEVPFEEGLPLEDPAAPAPPPFAGLIQSARFYSPDSRPDPALTRAAGEVRAAVAATASTPTGWATPDRIANRVDLKRTLKSLHLSMVGAIDIAHVALEVAATHPTLTGPARVIAMRAQ